MLQPLTPKPSTGSSADKFKLVAEISLTKACLMVIECLSKEEDWKVLKLVLVQVNHLFIYDGFFKSVKPRR